jgi:hypothetical protein
VSPFPESDWQKLRAIRDDALARFCRRALNDIREILEAADLDTNAHTTYLAVYRHLADQDAELAALFNDWRRSTALITLMGWARSGILTEEELESFSARAKGTVRELVEVVFCRDLKRPST